MKRNLIQIVIVAIIAFGGWTAVDNEQEIRDWWTLRSYEPSAEIVQLADTTAMTDTARRIFYASRPEINDRESFNANCVFVDKTIVLGCYAGEKIYIFDVTERKLDGIKEVTAAHEMLHAVFSRLDSHEKASVEAMLTQAFSRVEEKRIIETIDAYREDDPSSVINELHSILGTEVRTLSQELESYYSRYFTNRLTVVGIAEEYGKVFVELDTALTKLQTTLSELGTDVDTLEKQLSTEQSSLSNESTRLTGLRNDGNIAAYNAAVPVYNQRIVRYNDSVEQLKRYISQYNRLVKEFNETAISQNKLVQSIDSDFQPIDN